MRAIDADALCEDLLKRWSVAETRKEELIKAVMADVVTPIIACQPTIEPERKKGKWLLDNKSVYEKRFACSECHESEVVPTIGFTKYEPIWDFCPNCGAEMTEGEE